MLGLCTEHGIFLFDLKSEHVKFLYKKKPVGTWITIVPWVTCGLKLNDNKSYENCKIKGLSE